MYIDHDIKIVFIHVPRTGGSSIKEALGLYDKIYKKGRRTFTRVSRRIGY